jgi:hypothetical protein
MLKKVDDTPSRKRRIRRFASPLESKPKSKKSRESKKTLKMLPGQVLR